MTASGLVMGAVSLIVLIGGVVALQVWWRQHRAKETPVERRIEDREIDRETNVW
ncbi:hypothetical protein ACFQI3_14025 [Hansschlegelia quercus]|uniref:hypothetical protein n=1 Tax=Hansschlegelia quercus TaxID=2528245 RepID=UPI0013EEED6B|nr:hypothetical protein [Hansschlegelia quercus]